MQLDRNGKPRLIALPKRHPQHTRIVRVRGGASEGFRQPLWGIFSRFMGVRSFGFGFLRSFKFLFSGIPRRNENYAQSTSFGGDKIMDWGNPRSDRGTMRERAKPRQDHASQRTVAVRKRITAFGKRTVPRLRGRSRRGRRAFSPKQIAVKQHACLLLFWNFFLVGQEKSAPFPLLSKGFCKLL